MLGIGCERYPMAGLDGDAVSAADGHGRGMRAIRPNGHGGAITPDPGARLRKGGAGYRLQRSVSRRGRFRRADAHPPVPGNSPPQKPDREAGGPGFDGDDPPPASTAQKEPSDLRILQQFIAPARDLQLA